MCAQRATDGDIEYAYNTIAQFSSDMLEILKIDAKARQEEEEYNQEQKITPEKEEVIF